MLPAQPNQSIMSGMLCLEEIVSSNEPIGSRELARNINEEHTKINRILGTLCHLGYVEKTDNNKYRAGPAIHILSSLSLTSSNLLRCSVEPIKELLKTGLTVALGVLWKDNVSYIFHGNNKMPFENCIGSKELFPSERSSIGQVISAFKKNKGLTQEEKLIIKDGCCLIDNINKDLTLAVPIGNPTVIAGLAFAGKKKDLKLKSSTILLTEAATKINNQLNARLSK